MEKLRPVHAPVARMRVHIASPTVNNPMHVRERKIGNFPIPECDATGRIIMIDSGVFLFYASKEQEMMQRFSLRDLEGIKI